MPRIAFVTDSTAYIPKDLVTKYDLKVAPQLLIWGQEQLYDGVDITPSAFYARLKTAEVMPTTSEVNAGQFKQILDPLVAEGASVLMILISSKLSGTVNSANHAKGMLPGAKIEVVDSEAVAMALGFQVLAAARAAAEGKPFDQVVALARKAKEHTGVLFVVDTLEFLHRGGRIGGASKLLGSALNIKPILELREGRIESVEKIRTKAKALARMQDVLEERIGGRTPVRLSVLHAAAEDEARAVLDQVKARLKPLECSMTEVSPVVGTHAGPGTVGIAYSVGL